MEDDKKKRKNKKKKTKQATKPTETESVMLDANESTSDSQSHVQETGQNNSKQVSVIVDMPNDDKVHINADRDGHLDNGTEVPHLTEVEKQYWLDRQATFEDKIKELQTEKDAQIQKEAFLEEKIKQLMKEKDGNSEKEASLKEKIKELYDEKNASMRNGASLTEKLVRLEKDKEVFIKKEASLETEILCLEDEKNSWVKKEAGFEAKISQLVDEVALLNMKVVSLEAKIKQIEREKESWSLKENSADETIASLTNDNTKLQAQVIELEQSRDSLLNETQQLKETISILQLRMNNLEMDNKVASEDGNAKYQVEATHALSDKSIGENSQLVEKVNEQYAMLDQRGIRTQRFLSAGSVSRSVTAQSTDIAGGPDLMPNLLAGSDDRHITAHASDSISEANKTIPISESTSSLEDVMLKDQRNSSELLNVNGGQRISSSPEIIEAGEIVQIPLDENDAEEIRSEVAQNDEENDVLLTDAPLIGAPFRFISFVARYVSGSDLVEQNRGRSG